MEARSDAVKNNIALEPGRLGEKTLMLGKIEGREKETTEDEMVGWHH